MEQEHAAAYQLLEAGTQVRFEVLTTTVTPGPDGQSLSVRADLALRGDDEEEDPESVVERGAFGFIFVLAVLSFADARPRGQSVRDYEPKDDFGVSDFLGCLWFEGDRLHFFADYVRGRCMKTDIVLRGNGEVTMKTWGRGQEALRWLDRLQGKELLRVL